jgi:HNH endonuclease
VLRKWAAIWGIPVDHFDPYARHRGLRRQEKTPLAEILVRDSTYCRTNLKRRLYEEGLKQPRCEECHQGEIWRGRQMSLILDHINGVSNDNRLENLRILCPNCAATLDTHCGRKLRLVPVDCAVCGREFRPRYSKQRYCSRDCGQRWLRTGAHRAGARQPRPAARKVPRPTYEQLQQDLATMSVAAVGRKYGVSDNAIRKWMRWYEQAREVA